MINVVVGSSGNPGKRKSVIVGLNSTLRQVLEKAQIDYTKGIVSLDGVVLQSDDLNKTFLQHGIADRCYLLVSEYCGYHI